MDTEHKDIRHVDPTSINSFPAIYEPPRFEHTRVFFKECPIAGLSFHIKKGDELWDELSEGTKVALVRDHNNKHDRNAVAIALADDYDGDPDDFDLDFILGYIPRTENTAIAAMLDAGYFDKFEAEITTYKRYGSYDERIRITIWLRTCEPVMVRPNLLRADYLNFNEFLYFLEELKERGVAYMRWGGFPMVEHDTPILGERVVIITKYFSRVFMYLLKVIAVGDDCAIYFKDPAEIHCCDDCCAFILGNIAGPIAVQRNELAFFSCGELEDLSIHYYLKKEISDALDEIFDRATKYFSRNNIDAAPSIDEPIEK